MPALRALWGLLTGSMLWTVLVATVWLWLVCGLIWGPLGGSTERCGVAGLSTSCGSVR